MHSALCFLFEILSREEQVDMGEVTFEKEFKKRRVE